MNAASYTRRDLGSLVRFDLPPRVLGRWRWIGLVPLFIGIAIASIGVSWIATSPLFTPTTHAGSSIPGVLFACFGLIPCVVGAVPIALGMIIIAGRGAIELRRGRLGAVDHVGPLRWTRWRRVEDVKALELMATTTGPTGDLAALGARTTGRRKGLLIAWGHPAPLLRDLADVLAEECDAERPPAPDTAPIAVTEVTTTRDDDEDAPEPRPAGAPVPPQPTSSRATLEHTSDGVTLAIPPAGVWRGSNGMFPLGVAGASFAGAIGVIFVVSAGGVLAAVFPAICTLVGVAIFGTLAVAGYNVGTREAIFDVVDDALIISRRSLFGVTTETLARDAIRSIRVGPSGMKVNDVPVMCLRIDGAPSEVDRDGKRRLLSQLPNDELEWVAAVLNEALFGARDVND